MSKDQTACPKCTKIYNEKNPPRLLTMCGHTFCECCIKTLITKKKLNHKYKLTCPHDGSHIQLANPSPSIFPKNLSILNLVKNKFDENFRDSEFSIIEMDGEKSEIHSAKTLNICMSTMNRQSRNMEEQSQFDLKTQFMEQMLSQTCLLHQKALEIVCVKDCRRICPSCVIFGEHRGHKVKNVQQVNNMTTKLLNSLMQTSSQYEQCFKRLSSRDKMKQKIDTKLTDKKYQVQKIIKKKFKELSELIVQTQKKMLSKADKKIICLKNKCWQLLEEKINMQQNYSDWEESLINKIKTLKSQQEEQKYAVTLRSENFINFSQQLLEQVKSLEPQLIKQVDRICQNLSVVFDQQQVEKILKDFCKIQTSENSFLQMNESRASFVSRIGRQQSLLEDIDQTDLSLMIKSVDLSQSQATHKMKSTLQPTPSTNQKGSIMRLKSSHGHYAPSRQYKSPKMTSPLASSRLVNLGSAKSLLKNTVKLKKCVLQQKYQKNIQQITNGFSDVLDLTSGELGDDALLQILETVKSYPLTIVKLVKNKLTDSGFSKIQRLLQNTVMLNLSKNQLTSKTLERIISYKQSGKFKTLKSIMFGQNKIQQRKCKNEVQKMRRLGVNICL